MYYFSKWYESNYSNHLRTFFLPQIYKSYKRTRRPIYDNMILQNKDCLLQISYRPWLKEGNDYLIIMSSKASVVYWFSFFFFDLLIFKRVIFPCLVIPLSNYLPNNFWLLFAIICYLLNTYLLFAKSKGLLAILLMLILRCLQAKDLGKKLLHSFKHYYWKENLRCGVHYVASF